MDLIHLASPNYPHFKYLVNLIKSKKIKYILCEKPMCLNLDEILMYLNMAHKNSIVLFFDFELRFNGYFKEIKNLIDYNKIGNIKEVTMKFESNLYNIISQNSWMLDFKKEGGISNAIIPHFIDLLLYFLDKNFIEISEFCVESDFKSNIPNIDKECFVTMNSGNNLKINFLISGITNKKMNLEIKIEGEKGGIFFSLDRGLFLNNEKLTEKYSGSESLFRKSFESYAAFSYLIKLIFIQ